MSQKNTIWELDSHSVGKHIVLKGYLDAWFPIMGSQSGRILFIDGYAGPGIYTGGEEGSPLIAIRAYKEHSALKNIQAEVCFVFIEKDKKRAEHLENLISDIDDLPPKSRTRVTHGVFDETMTQELDMLDNQRKNLAPAFVMIDPFGISGTPMSLIQRILRNPRSEVYITFMYEWINRFKGTPEFEQHMDAFFGCSTRRQALVIDNPTQRKNYLYMLYEEQVRNAGAKHVVHFELYEGRRLVNAIFFGTQSVTGCERMKRAIWNIAPWGDFAFYGSKTQQLTLGLSSPDFEPLKQSLRLRFRGVGWVPIDDVIKYVSSDQTDYLVSHLRKGALIPMEKAKEIEIDESTRNRRKTYPKGTLIRFI